MWSSWTFQLGLSVTEQQAGCESPCLGFWGSWKEGTCFFVTLSVDSGRPRWICDVYALGATPGGHDFPSLQWGEVKGVSSEMQRTRQKRDNQSYQASWEVSEKANVFSFWRCCSATKVRWVTAFLSCTLLRAINFILFCVPSFAPILSSFLLLFASLPSLLIHFLLGFVECLISLTSLFFSFSLPLPSAFLCFWPCWSLNSFNWNLKGF